MSVYSDGATTPPLSASITTSEGQPVAKKRRRIHTACKNCQARKTRCDGGRPACAGCCRRGLANECVYDTSSGAAHGYFASLENRLDRLERAGVATAPADYPSEGEGNILREPVCGAARKLPATVNHPFRADASRPQIAITSQRAHQVSDVDGLATVSAIEDAECLYGPSSTIAFMRTIQPGKGESPATDRGTVRHQSTTPQPTATSRPEVIRDKNLSVVVYPPRRTADEYLRCFWEFIHPLFPVVHKTAIMREYEALWTSSENTEDEDPEIIDKVIFSSTLNVVFALDCQFSKLVPASNKALVAAEFYQRSRSIYTFEILNSSSVPLVQMLLLNGIYLQSTRHASRCWNVVGLAIRVAQSLGLHIESDSQPQISREMRRRIWHTCIVLDKLLGMTFGRPTMISQKGSTKLPSLIDDEYLQAEGEGSQPVTEPSRLGLLVCSSQLFDILDEILAKSAATKLTADSDVSVENETQLQHFLSEVMILNRRLNKFLDTIPEYLVIAIQMPDPNRQTTSVTIQAQVLHCRLLYTRVLLLRPLLLLATTYPSRFLPLSPSVETHSLDNELIRRCCNLCVKTARQLVENIYQNLESSYRSSGWHSVYFTFSASIIFLAALKCPAVDAVTIKVSFDIWWNRCLDILGHYKNQIQSASQAILVLQAMRNQIDTSQSFQGQELAAPATETVNPFMQALQQFVPPASFNEVTYGADPICDAWFSQSTVNLDWLELG